MRHFSVSPVEMFVSFWRNRELIKASVKREVLGRYRGSFLGHRSIEMYLRYRSVRPEQLDATMARLDAAVNTLITPACSPTV